MRVLIIFTVLAIAGVGVWFINSDDSDLANITSKTEDTLQSVRDEESMNTRTDETGAFMSYSETNFAASTTDRNVLFFHASWCPTCRSLERSISSGNIPEDLTIYKVDFDNSNDLKRTHGVTLQHTLVQVDKSGASIQRFVGTPTLDDLVANLR